MKIANIDRLLLFRVENDNEFTMGQLTKQYQFEPDGTNLYFGVNDVNHTSFQNIIQALNPTNNSYIDGLIGALEMNQQNEKTLNRGVEPSAPTFFDCVAANGLMMQAQPA